MRVITGTSKGKKLRSLSGRSVRPTSDRVKESIFNILGDEVKGRTVLDLFAGTGNLGIEALSRGAAKVVFVEKARQASQLIQQNLSHCQVEGRSEVLPWDAVRAIKCLERRHDFFDLILMDPPYRKGWVSKTLATLMSQPIYHDHSILVLEHDRREPLPEVLGPWELIRERRMGDTIVSFLLSHKQRFSAEMES
jgi:16S rRNA (guanine(966)-N(2))-methyltransferase RsmD